MIDGLASITLKKGEFVFYEGDEGDEGEEGDEGDEASVVARIVKLLSGRGIVSSLEGRSRVHARNARAASDLIWELLQQLVTSTSCWSTIRSQSAESAPYPDDEDGSGQGSSFDFLGQDAQDQDPLAKMQPNADIVALFVRMLSQHPTYVSPVEKGFAYQTPAAVESRSDRRYPRRVLQSRVYVVVHPTDF